MAHVVWDWNGTLYDDLAIVVGAVNASLDLFAAPHITADDYRDQYTRPVKVFYDRLLRRDVTPAEWELIDFRFHEVYRASLDRASLTTGTREVLETLRGAGHTQSILSMWWHDELVPMTERLGVAEYMVRVDGNTADAGDRKTSHLGRHLAALNGHAGDPSRDVVMVGDSLDDGLAARDNAIRCVMFDSGSHHRHELESTGHPVAQTLHDVLELAGLP